MLPILIPKGGNINLHPAIRLVCFLILVTGLLVTSQTMLLIILPFFLWLFKRHCTFSSVWPLLKRLRWLFLSLLILNLAFLNGAPTLIPNLSDFLQALERIVVLIIIVMAAHLLVNTTTTQEIIAALQWWFIPFNKLGLSTERLAVRLALVLDTVQAVQNLYTELSPTTSSHPLKNISEKVAELFTQVMNHAETTPLRTLDIPQLSKPPIIQWCYPIFMLVLFSL